MRRLSLVFILCIIAGPRLFAAPGEGIDVGGTTDRRPEPWAGLRFLVGDWKGEGGPDSGRGEFSFHFELGREILVRRSFAEYPATGNRAAFRHDDLLVVYAEPGHPELAAIYFDGEGHVIHYLVTGTADGKSAVFLSESVGGAPHYRLTYERVSDDGVDVKFEIAPPGEPSRFEPYLAARCHRVGRK